MAKKIQCDGCDKLEDESTANSTGWDILNITTDRMGHTFSRDLCKTCLDIFMRKHIPEKWTRVTVERP